MNTNLERHILKLIRADSGTMLNLIYRLLEENPSAEAESIRTEIWRLVDKGIINITDDLTLIIG